MTVETILKEIWQKMGILMDGVSTIMVTWSWLVGELTVVGMGTIYVSMHRMVQWMNHQGGMNGIRK